MNMGESSRHSAPNPENDADISPQDLQVIPNCFCHLIELLGIEIKTHFAFSKLFSCAARVTSQGVDRGIARF
jgi:hypothetical protein